MKSVRLDLYLKLCTPSLKPTDYNLKLFLALDNTWKNFVNCSEVSLIFNFMLSSYNFAYILLLLCWLHEQYCNGYICIYAS